MENDAASTFEKRLLAASSTASANVVFSTLCKQLKAFKPAPRNARNRRTFVVETFASEFSRRDGERRNPGDVDAMSTLFAGTRRKATPTRKRRQNRRFRPSNELERLDVGNASSRKR